MILRTIFFSVKRGTAVFPSLVAGGNLFYLTQEVEAVEFIKALQSPNILSTCFSFSLDGYPKGLLKTGFQNLLFLLVLPTYSNRSKIFNFWLLLHFAEKSEFFKFSFLFETFFDFVLQTSCAGYWGTNFIGVNFVEIC